MSARWYPVMTRETARPEPGDLIAHRHAVWRVLKVEDVPLTEVEEQQWQEEGCPDWEQWGRLPYRVTVEWVAGAAQRADVARFVDNGVIA